MLISLQTLWEMEYLVVILYGRIPLPGPDVGGIEPDRMAICVASLGRQVQRFLFSLSRKVASVQY